jgi:hypothetical protein
MTRKHGKTKKVGGVDLGQHCFAFAGDPENTDTWKHPIFFPGDEGKSINHIKSSLSRFDETKGIPESERRTVWLILTGAAKAHGLHVEPKHFQSESQPTENKVAQPCSVPGTTVEVELKALELNNANGLTDAEMAEAIAIADQRSDAVLKSLGL